MIDMTIGNVIENFCCDEMFGKNYYCNTIHDDHMRFKKPKGTICENCMLYLFKLRITNLNDNTRVREGS